MDKQIISFIVLFLIAITIAMPTSMIYLWMSLYFKIRKLLTGKKEWT